MVAREQSLDPTFNLEDNARADSLTEDERREVLEVRSRFPLQPLFGTSRNAFEEKRCVTIQTTVREVNADT